VCCWVKAGAVGLHLLRAPTIVAWDLNAVCRHSLGWSCFNRGRLGVDNNGASFELFASLG
jgi:hypothetical protein